MSFIIMLCRHPYLDAEIYFKGQRLLEDRMKAIASLHVAICRRVNFTYQAVYRYTHTIYTYCDVYTCHGTCIIYALGYIVGDLQIETLVG